MSLIEISNLTFAYEGASENVFEHVSARIDTDWRLGLTGRNGRGKTTLLRLLDGTYPSGGAIRRTVQCEYFPYEPPAGADTAARIVRALDPDLPDWVIEREMNALGVAPDAMTRPFASLSEGEQGKVLLAALFLKENRFLLIDEPTNHLDMAARARLAAYLKGKRGFILVSHDRAFLDACIDHVMAINRAGIEIRQGDYSAWQRDRALRDAYELAEDERLRRDVKRLSAAARQAGNWSDKVEKTKIGQRNSGVKPDRGYIGNKSAKMMKRAKAIEDRKEDALAEKSKLLKNLETDEPLKLSPLTYRAQVLARLDGVSVVYGGLTVCRDVRFEIARGDRVSLAGRNGCGKSSILNLVCGADIEHAGRVQVGSGLIISRVRQDFGRLSGSLRGYARNWGVDESLLMTILRKLGFTREQFEIDLADYSAGQKKKVMLARSLSERAHLYVWDEPLNYVDVISRMQIESLIRDFSPTLLFVEHDRAFCDNVATQTVQIVRAL